MLRPLNPREGSGRSSHHTVTVGQGKPVHPIIGEREAVIAPNKERAFEEDQVIVIFNVATVIALGDPGAS